MFQHGQYRWIGSSKLLAAICAESGLILVSAESYIRNANWNPSKNSKTESAVQQFDGIPQHHKSHEGHSYPRSRPSFQNFDTASGFTHAYGQKESMNFRRVNPTIADTFWLLHIPIQSKAFKFWRNCKVPAPRKHNHRVFFVRFKLRTHLLNCHIHSIWNRHTPRHLGWMKTLRQLLKLLQ